MFKDYYIDYLNYVEVLQKPQSIRSLKERFDNIILPYFGSYNINSISKHDVIDFLSYLHQKKYSFNYIRNIFYLCSGFFNYLVSFDFIDSNVFRDVGFKLSNYKFRSKNFYTFKEFKLFIKYSSNPLYTLFFTFLFFTGVRPGEAFALKFSDLHSFSVKINKTIDSHGSRDVSFCKTFSSYRTISIPFKLYFQLLLLKYFYISKYGFSDFYIFGGIKPLSPTTINRYKFSVCFKAHLIPITLHGFRHSHATLLLDKGLSIEAISKRLGHSSSDITLRVYTHVTNKQEKRVLQTLNFLNFLV